MRLRKEIKFVLKSNRLDFRGGGTVPACGISNETEPSADRLKFRSILRSRLAGFGDANG